MKRYAFPFAILALVVVAFAALPVRLLDSGYVTKADFTTTSDTAVDITDLYIETQAGEIWEIEGALKLGCSGGATAGSRPTVTVPSGATFWCEFRGNTSTKDAHRAGTVTSSAGTGPQLNARSSTDGWCRFHGYVANSQYAGGKIQIQIRSNTSGETSTVYIGSYVRGRRVPAR